MITTTVKATTAIITTMITTTSYRARVDSFFKDAKDTSDGCVLPHCGFHKNLKIFE